MFRPLRGTKRENTMDWNASFYADKHRFVAACGMRLLEFVDRSRGRSILDLGCGTGELTAELAVNGADVLGIDASADMIRLARETYPTLHFKILDALRLNFDAEFDTVFSNAVFHWIPDQDRLLGCIRQALKPDGRLVCEFGAADNARQVLATLFIVFAQHGRRFEHGFFYPTPDAYSQRLELNGFKPERVIAYDRPTPLRDGEAGLRNWIMQFLHPAFTSFSSAEQKAILSETETRLRPHLWDGIQWTVDYRRLLAVAHRQD